MNNETNLTGGRVTAGVVKIGSFVHRPCCENSEFVHSVLLWLEKKSNPYSPRYIGTDEKGREITTYFEGYTPDNLGGFSTVQLNEAGKIISHLHKDLSDYPDCLLHQTVCHNDLSPCNFRFYNGMPYAVFNWDSAKVGMDIDDLAYASWMWCDIGNAEQSSDAVACKMRSLLEGYRSGGSKPPPYAELISNIYVQMRRVGGSIFPTEEQTHDTAIWATNCNQWLQENEKTILDILST